MVVKCKTVTGSLGRKRNVARKAKSADKSLESSKARRVRKQPVDDSLVLGHQAIWLEGRVPNGYWDRLEHRLLYMRWLGQQLGFRKREDWYRITTNDFKRNSGNTLLRYFWHDSAICAVKECFPDYEWKDWLFAIAPRHYWKAPENHRHYMDWLGQQLGIRCPADWYRVTVQDFKDHKGEAFLIHYDSAVSLAVMNYLPDYDWKEWKFSKAPNAFWQEKKNRKRYVLWLGQELGFKKTSDWYAVTADDFNSNYGKYCLTLYGGSPVAVLRDCFPRYTWHEWMFIRVPCGFWDSLENRRRYMRWLAKKLKFRKPEDWSKVRIRDFLDNYGSSLLGRYRSYHDLMKECVPGT